MTSVQPVVTEHQVVIAKEMFTEVAALVISSYMDRKWIPLELACKLTNLNINTLFILEEEGYIEMKVGHQTGTIFRTRAKGYDLVTK